MLYLEDVQKNPNWELVLKLEAAHRAKNIRELMLSALKLNAAI